MIGRSLPDASLQELQNQELQNWRVIANNLNISDEAIRQFNEHFSSPNAFRDFQTDSPDTVIALANLEPENISLRFFELNSDEQSWLTTHIEGRLQAARAIGSILNQVNVIIDFATRFESHLEACQAALDTRMRSRLEIERAKQLILNLISEILDNEERFQEAEQFIDGHLLSITEDTAKLAWLSEKTEALCQEEKYYRIWQTLGLALNQAELLDAVNDKIDIDVEEVKRGTIKRYLTTRVAATDVALQLSYLSSLYQNKADFSVFLTQAQQAERNVLDAERRIATILRYDYGIQPEMIGKFRKVIQKAAPNDIGKQQTLFTNYEESIKKEELSLAGFKRYVNSKKETEKPAEKREKKMSATSSSTTATQAIVNTSVLKKRERVSLVDSDDEKSISRLQDVDIKEKSKKKRRR